VLLGLFWARDALARSCDRRAGVGVADRGCGGGDKTRSADALTSPVSGETRSVGKHESLVPVIVSPVEPAVPFRGSGGAYLVSYELRVFNATPLTLVPARVSVSSPSAEVIEKLDRAQVTDALALPGTRSGVGELRGGSRRRSISR
jgi:hypothetical protein